MDEKNVFQNVLQSRKHRETIPENDEICPEKCRVFEERTVQ